MGIQRLFVLDRTAYYRKHIFLILTKMPPKKSTAEKKTTDDAPKEKKQNGLTKPMNLSDELAAIVGAKKGEKLARSEIVKRLWAYLKEKQLQDPENKQFFTPDALMQPVFGKEKMRAFAMSKYLA